ncbi:uncharacterized protein BCR38DRAFT_419137 [Pseudomassariella vexata]|uniref:tRNA-intron lyase n=1 Tax=Pseudomassariella vexata TaxID=1141098 RepID=A0A1Y2EKU4_9PEZI|nr:uncharacterized protein BCR38DRAFT_419137 [Pseudomassariella vexata]ORY72167.1 hypothetical protein BCR38DRAFT_419137 [Pseudomassariella vexata]
MANTTHPLSDFTAVAKADADGEAKATALAKPRENGQPRTVAPETPAHSVSSAPLRPALWQIHALPAPIRTYPLPAFYPSNPLSLLHIAYTWISQTISPPREPSVVHEAIWSSKTRSVNVTDPKSIRALWEQGFYGKGIFSRSEPNWLKKQQARRDVKGKSVAEMYTLKRREERKQMKWDRARKEQELIQRTRFEEMRVAPVGPNELLTLPNSPSDLHRLIMSIRTTNEAGARQPMNGAAGDNEAQVPIEESPRQPNGILKPDAQTIINGTTDGNDTISPFPPVDDDVERPQTPQGALSSSPPDGTSSLLRRRKSVRFSPNVESTTFKNSDPPTPNICTLSNGNIKAPDSLLANGTSPLSHEPGVPSVEAPVDAVGTEIPQPVVAGAPELVDKEHLQLTLEETFFLVFGLGALTVRDECSGSTFPVEQLFSLCRQQSYIPTKKGDLQPDDPFMIQYVVYHHFRSLGWVPRPGVKFGCDWLLYQRGPAFNHGEFAVVVMPSYSHPHWKALGCRASPKSWHWLHAINRVQSGALKSMVLVYVDVPPPAGSDEDIPTTLKRYKIREVMIRRWSTNRNRD